MSDTMERISAARTYLTAKVPFLGFMALRLRPKLATEADMVETAGVGPDGTLIVNEEYVKGLTDPQVRGLMAMRSCTRPCASSSGWEAATFEPGTGLTTTRSTSSSRTSCRDD